MAGKKIETWYLDEIPQTGPIPSRWELEFKTNDGWFYLYTAAQRGDPFVFRLKRRPDGSSSRDEITPRRIKDYFERNPLFELVDEKLVYRGEYRTRLEVNAEA